MENTKKKHLLVGTDEQGNPKLYEIGKPLVKEIYEKHKDIIIAFLRGERIEVLTFYGSWVYVEKPHFFYNYTYRIKQTPLFTNSVGEEFTQQDFKDDITVWWFNFTNKTLVHNEICEVEVNNLKEDFESTECFKTPEGALKAAAEIFKGNKR